MSDTSLHTVLRALSSHSPHGVICLDGTGRPLWWNASASRFFFSVTPEATTTARRVDDLLCATNADALQGLLNGSQGKSQATLETLDGEIPVELSLFHVASPDNPPGGLKLLIVQPSSLACGDWPADTFRLFATLLHRVKNAFAAVKLLAQGAQIELTVTHRPTLSLMQMVESSFRRIDGEVDRAGAALDTVKHLLAATGARAKPVSLGPIVRSLMEEHAERMVSAGVTVGRVTPGTPGQAHVDPDAFRQIVQNLMDRVRMQALLTGRRRHLDVLLEQRESHLALIFRDDGPPIDPETVSRLAHGEFTSSQEELPLMVVHWIVDRFKGRVFYSSPEEPGCTIEVVLPRASTPGPSHPLPEQARAAGGSRA